MTLEIFKGRNILQLCSINSALSRTALSLTVSAMSTKNTKVFANSPQFAKSIVCMNKETKLCKQFRLEIIVTLCL